MARRGRLGRRRQAAPNITSTIISIAREMESARDRNIMDAWEKGGMFEGKPVTDEILLAHWRGRLKDIDKDDPLYDTYKNTVMQTEYSIGESKAATAYAQGKLSDRGMAQFYLNWAKKVPRDSEFYRTLQRDAAQFMRASAAKGRASAKQAAEKGYQSAQDATKAKYEAAGEYMTDTLRSIAQQHGLVGMDVNGQRDNASDLVSFAYDDPGRLIAIMDEINRSPGHTIFNDPVTGVPVTGQDIIDRLKTLDPNFSGKVTTDYYTSTLDRQMQGQNIRLDRAVATEHKDDANTIRNQQAWTAEYARESRIWPAEKSYQVLRDQFAGVWQNDFATPMEKMTAWNRYANALTKLANDPKNPLDQNTKTRIMAEVNGDAGVDSLAENALGLGAGDHATPEGQAGDIAGTHADIAFYQGQIESVAAGAAYWVVNSSTGQIEATSVQPPPGAIQVFLPQGAGEPPLPVVVGAKQITAEVVDAATGGRIPSANVNQEQVGLAYDLVIDGKAVRMYAYRNAEGQTVYTREAPWDTASGNIVAQDVQGGGVHLVIRTDPTVVDGVNLQRDEDGDLIASPVNMALTSNPSRALAGFDPTTDSVSPTIALLSSTADGVRRLAELQKDQGFRQAIDAELRANAGFTQDPTTGEWLGGDEIKYAQSLTATAYLSRGPEFQADVQRNIGEALSLFGRALTTGTFGGVKRPPQFGGASPDARDQQLPADQARGSVFAPLADVFKPGTNLVRPSILEGDTRGQINIAGKITVPALPNVMPTPLQAQQAFAPKPITPTPTPVPVPTLASPINSSTGFTLPPSMTPLKRPPGTGPLEY